ncbi:MAG TPA: hypothetical protein VK157_13345 [Phycisphaerales bacterium]|nr:hypothetical protein [Phycisphaerales bacterium]
MKTATTLTAALLLVTVHAATCVAQESASISLTGLRIQNASPQNRTSAPNTISPANRYTVSFSADTRVRGVGGALGSVFPTPVTIDQVLHRFDPTADFPETTVVQNCNASHPFVLASTTFSQSTTVTVVIPLTVNFSATFRSEIDANNVPGFSIISPVLTVSPAIIQPGYLEFTAGTLTFARNPRPACDSIDFNNNGVFPEDQDVIDFFAVLAGAECATCSCIDFNANTVFPEDQDVIDFFTVLAGGDC